MNMQMKSKNRKLTSLHILTMSLAFSVIFVVFFWFAHRFSIEDKIIEGNETRAKNEERIILNQETIIGQLKNIENRLNKCKIENEEEVKQ